MKNIYEQTIEQQSTGSSFFTPPKGRNLSKIQTNPSSNMSSIPSNQFIHQYSSIQLSQSLNNSPSFYSPTKQLGSFLITPNYSLESPNRSINTLLSPQKTQKIGSAQILPINIRLRTQSDGDKPYSTKSDNAIKLIQIQPKQVDEEQIKQLFKMMSQFRIKSQKVKTNNTNIKSLQFRNKFLSKTVQNKQQEILEDKKQVQKLIKKKKQLKKKLKQKKQRVRNKQIRILDDLQRKMYSIRDQLDKRQKDFQLQLQRFSRYKMYNQQIYANIYKHNINQVNYQFHPAYQQQYQFYPNLRPQLNSLHSSTQKMNVPPYHDPYQIYSKLSDQQFKQNFSRNPTPNTAYFGTPNGGNLSPIASNNIDPFQAMRLALASKFNPKAVNPKNNDQQDLQQLIGSLKGQQNTPQKHDTRSNIQSSVHIDLQSQVFSPIRNRKQTQVSSARREYEQNNASHKRVPSGLTIKIPQNFAQSQVNINYQSSEQSDFNVHRINEISPRVQLEYAAQRRRSPTQQINSIHPKIFQQITKLRKTQKSRQWIVESGQQTPIFRSQVTQSQIRFSQPLLLGQGQLKKSQAGGTIQEHLNQNDLEQDSMMRKSWNKSKNKIPQKDLNVKNNSSEVREIRLSKKQFNVQKQNNLGKTQKKSSSEEDQRNLNDQDDQFWSCTLGADSKISLVNKNNQASSFDDMYEVESQKMKTSSKSSSNFDQFENMDEQQRQLRKSNASNVIKIGKSQTTNKKSSSSSEEQVKSLSLTTKNKKATFEAVIEQSEQSQEDKNYTDRKKQRQDMSKSTL